ncbi:MAG: ATP-dependent sacrificial sulfur transferase LarE [Deferribacteraceae bacterium]|jgi:uncharacterized protein|nr:ATP-dependent sacrificial sulfur transferase LarE [Deferribacteraceae bacterium]
MRRVIISAPGEADKLKTLTDFLKTLPTLAVAFSGGTDSAFLLKIAKGAIGGRVVAITARSLLFPEREVEAAQSFCREQGVEHILIRTEELHEGNFADNPHNRCYLCKKALFAKVRSAAEELCITDIAEGSNADDILDYRPGLEAVKEDGILSPLKAAGLTKGEIRRLSRQLNLSTWDKPAFACLASRFPYGERITTEALSKVEAAEQYIFDLGVRQVRVRCHRDTARIETDENGFAVLTESAVRDKVVSKFKALGFTYVSLDLQGYRMGSMNENFR